MVYTYFFAIHMKCGEIVNAASFSQPRVGSSRPAPPIVWAMAKSNDIIENFSAMPRDSLRARFGRIPSAAVVAREFNLRAYDTAPFSQESARRWLRGVSLPEEERLRVLVNWLNLDFNEALKPRAQLLAAKHFGPRGHPNASNGNGLELGQGNGDPPPNPHAATIADTTRLSGAHVINGLAKEEDELIRLMTRLDSGQRAALLDLLKLNFGTHQPAR